MKLITLFSMMAVSVVNAATFPTQSLLECKIVVNKNSVNVIKIGIANLGTPKASLVNLAKNEEEGPILFSEKNKEIGDNMNAQGGDLRVTDKTIELRGDDDGCSYVRIVLFKDSNYTRGWASESGSEVPHWYSKDVSCEVK